MKKNQYFINYSMRLPPAATTRSSLDHGLWLTLLMVMAAQVALTRSVSFATLGDLSLHETPPMWFQILYSKGAQSGLEGG